MARRRYDDVTRPAWFPGGYNGVMQHFADLDTATWRRSIGGTFVNLNPPVVAAHGEGAGAGSAGGKLLLPDRVHPEPLAHWVMAEALLKGWNAPALVSSVTIDGQAGEAGDAQNATVKRR